MTRRSGVRTGPWPARRLHLAFSDVEPPPACRPPSAVAGQRPPPTPGRPARDSGGHVRHQTITTDRFVGLDELGCGDEVADGLDGFRHADRSVLCADAGEPVGMAR